MQRIEKQDVYTRITNQVVSHLEKGVRPWVRPWNAEHAAGRITRPLRHNGTPYSGINVLSLWASAMAQNFAAPIWMTFKQASELAAHIRKGEKGSLVVYANTFSRTEEDAEGNEVEHEIPFLKGYTVFNVDQIEGLPANYYEKPEPKFSAVERIERAGSDDLGHFGGLYEGGYQIQQRPVALDGQVVIRPMMYVALTYDHRIVDGREAVQFLVRIKECVENPERLLLEV